MKSGVGRRADAPTPTDEASRPRHVTQRDGGYSLIEIVIAITLMALLVVPILAAVQMSISSSSRGRSAAQVETAIVNAADRVNRAGVSCDYLEYVQAAVRSQGWDGDRATVVQEHYVRPTALDGAGSWAAGACELTTPTDFLVQRVTITIASPDNSVSRSIQVVKSDV